jgi:hypothetical protein
MRKTILFVVIIVCAVMSLCIYFTVRDDSASRGITVNGKQPDKNHVRSNTSNISNQESTQNTASATNAPAAGHVQTSGTLAVPAAAGVGNAAQNVLNDASSQASGYGTGSMVGAHASLLIPSVSDPDSMENKAILQQMMFKALAKPSN